ncbi:helix-turn-helix domain-containing protein [Xanthobacter aminoxidans]|uniref:helix-turn-helix domain-containing protein n=1 Tax=Xanthobacter aminoxidans TaxID=186280 RepID=UPI002022D685|nr:helix-turn-helix transcriptional regulator [Xanthobacter aminoxidans]MCL8385934.1 helix-turn-helix domain-containing protein [Xanthobacter aminoxidans]
MEDLQRTLASNLRRYRLQAGLSQEEIAERMSVDRAYVSGLERGRRNPTLSTLVSAGQALGVPVATLLTEEPTSEEAPKRVRAPRRKPTG